MASALSVDWCAHQVFVPALSLSLFVFDFLSVFPPLGCSLYDFLRANHFRPMFPHHIKHIAQQLLTTCAGLHQIGVVHADIKPSVTGRARGRAVCADQRWMRVQAPSAHLDLAMRVSVCQMSTVKIFCSSTRRTPPCRSKISPSTCRSAQTFAWCQFKQQRQLRRRAAHAAESAPPLLLLISLLLSFDLLPTLLCAVTSEPPCSTRTRSR